MIRHATEVGSAHEIFLFYSIRRFEEGAFLEELREIQELNHRFKFIPTITHPDGVPHHWRGELGHITEPMLNRWLPVSQAPVFYIAGPPGMVDGMRRYSVMPSSQKMTSALRSSLATKAEYLPNESRQRSTTAVRRRQFGPFGLAQVGSVRRGRIPWFPCRLSPRPESHNSDRDGRRSDLRRFAGSGEALRCSWALPNRCPGLETW